MWAATAGARPGATSSSYARDGHVIGISSPNMTADYLIGVTKSDPGTVCAAGDPV